MKSASVRDLRNRYASLLDWIVAGEEIVITRRGKAVARLIPEQGRSAKRVDWSRSPAVKRKRSSSQKMTAVESSELIHQAASQW
ncbi:type II toxin-antitoxin system prevent-host-death family antitoxin [Kamptonema cortianum]|nr:type II toxin-antitoxin system prevent-host-death family antitoxin [Oscillatoria laete-virens]MDK3158035.1 type II toxin-antitoxin system prevent-host-death family antitoxin [Kamptonema cortianum]MDL5048198.1 type II toxin-antitoxin system prevent-host-death family antitoxin [Oscillatoria amoena NRMC-F 0135]MDL5053090.1 type II toxin-antitoxin system prevent-host-death family antitoxin [Oscillatoria laete-virens NRMC-F 0139]